MSTEEVVAPTELQQLDVTLTLDLADASSDKREVRSVLGGRSEKKQLVLVAHQLLFNATSRPRPGRCCLLPHRGSEAEAVAG